MAGKKPSDQTDESTALACCSAGSTVARLARLVDAALQPSGLSLPHFRLLTYLRDGVHAPTALAGRMTISRAGISSIIDGLEDRGLVRRDPHDDDGRRRVTRLTRSGAAILDELEAAVDERLKVLASSLSETECEEAFYGLGLWGRAIEQTWKAESASGQRPAEWWGDSGEPVIVRGREERSPGK